MKITKQTTKEEIMAMNHLYDQDLKDCHEMLTDDEDVVLQFIEFYWGNLEYASDRIRNDREFIKLAIQKNPACFMYASDDLRKDKKLILELIEMYNAQTVYYVCYALGAKIWEHLKPHAIEYLKKELEKEGKL